MPAQLTRKAVCIGQIPNSMTVYTFPLIFRPTASEVLNKLESIYKIEEDPYAEINLVDLISKTDKNQSTSFTEVQEEPIPLEQQIEAIKVYSNVPQCMLLRG